MTTRFPFRVRELTVRYEPVREGMDALFITHMLTGPIDAAPLFLTRLEHEPNEVFAMLCLTTRHGVIGYHDVARGALDSVTAAPRDVALLANAAAIIVAHNHPSGDPTPSEDDRRMTDRLVAAGELLGVSVLDHIIVGDNRYFSFLHRDPDRLKSPS